MVMDSRELCKWIPKRAEENMLIISDDTRLPPEKLLYGF